MPCYECSMLGYSVTCQACSRFTATTPMTPPSSPASSFSFSFKCTPLWGIHFPASETPFTRDDLNYAIEQLCLDRPKLEAVGSQESSTRTPHFKWSEMDFLNEQHAFDSCNINFDDAHSPVPEIEPGFHSKCAVCSMVPYGTVCTKCNQIQTSKAIAFSTLPAAAWPVTNRLGDWEAMRAPEEELLRNLDMGLFEQINVPHELDEWGRRVYNDCGHRILYYHDSDGNTVMGYEAWYPSSVTGDYEEPDDWRTGRQIHDSAVDNEAQSSEYDDCGNLILNSADSDEDTVVEGSESWYETSATSEYEEPDIWRAAGLDDVPVVDFEQQRFAEFLAAQDEELPHFQSDRERIAAWIATPPATDDEHLSMIGHGSKEMGLQMVY